MTRKPRFNTVNIPRYITQLGINRQACFFSDEDYEFYLECLYDAAERWQCEIHAYTLLPNHIHILLTPRVKNGISKCMQSVNRRYVQYINSIKNRKGTLWAGRYTESLVDDEYLLDCYRFIEQRPVVTKLVNNSLDYKWTSHSAHVNGEVNNNLIEHSKYIELDVSLSAKKTAYSAFFKNKQSDKRMEMIRKAIRYGHIIGDPESINDVESIFLIDKKPKKRGRPRKHFSAMTEAKLSFTNKQ